jgi:flagellar FliL protein
VLQKHKEIGVNKMVVIGIAVAALLIGGGGAAVFFMNQEPAQQGPVVDARPFQYVPVPSVVANFQVGSGMRYVQITVNLQTRDVPSSDKMKANTPLIQGEILMLLQELRFSDIDGSEGKKNLVAQIEQRVTALFSGEPESFELERAVLTGFVVQ